MLKLLSKAYSNITRFHNSQFDKGKKFVYHSGIPVISIGNLSSGGSGKTPLTIYTAQLLLSLNITPGIIGRGYRGKFKGTSVVSDGLHVFLTPESSGDEMYMIAKNVPVPVVIDRHKYIAAEAMERKFSPDCILVDDGFQHRHLARNLDILIIDENTVANPYILPAGPLREDPSAIRRADVICYSCHKNELEKLLSPIKKNIAIFELRTRSVGFVGVFDSSMIIKKIPSAFVFSGIANPSRFERSVNKSGTAIVGELFFDDHHSYSTGDIRTIIERTKLSGVKTVITTEKDSVKLLKYRKMFETSGILPCYLKISSDLPRSDKFTAILLNTLNNKKTNDR